MAGQNNMKDFEGKVAVITGGASGIGRGIAERCAKEQMKIVLADINAESLNTVAEEFRSQRATVLAVQTDVADASSVKVLAKRVQDEFGAVHLLFNNAGVAGKGIMDGSLEDHKWLFGINLWGVIHGIHYFLPMMQEPRTEAHIINTASVAGLTSYTGMYTVTKHAVVSLSEVLRHELMAQRSKVKVSVLCPGAVDTELVANSENVRSLSDLEEEEELQPEHDHSRELVLEALKRGVSPSFIADVVFDAIQSNTFYILPSPELNPMIEQRHQSILKGKAPKPAIVGFLKDLGLV
jgi:NAD(P)-dependent dehydrogenase (short-subunit alcohol dehydrogenase family)